MARIALVNIGMHGHVNPTLGFTEELVRRGHTVDFFTTADFAGVVTKTGAHCIAYPSTIGQHTAQFAAEKSGERCDGTPAASPSSLARMLDEFTGTLPFLLQALTASKPDLLIYDFISLAAYTVAMHLDIKTMKFFTTYASNEHYNLLKETFAKHDFPTPEQIAQTQVLLQSFCARFALQAPSLAAALTEIDDDNLVFMPRSFQPHGDTFDQRFHFVGPCLRSSHAGDALDLLPGGDGPVLLVSLGSLFHAWPEFYQYCIQAFGNTRWRVVMSIGDRIDRVSLGVLPANIVVKDHLPQVALLALADVFISHGGMNSTMEALSFGVPLVVIPQIEEQEVTAQRVAELGLGRCLRREEVTKELLAQAVDEISSSAEVATNIALMQTQVASGGGSQRTADLVEARLLAATPPFASDLVPPSIGLGDGALVPRAPIPHRI